MITQIKFIITKLQIIKRIEEKKTYSRGVSSSHPPEFYYEIDKKFIHYVLENYKD